MISLILKPIYRVFRSLKIPRLLSSTVIVGGLVAILILGIYQAFIPGMEWMRTMNQEQMIGKVQGGFKPMKKVREEIKEMAKRVVDATAPSSDPVAGANKTTEDKPTMDPKDESFAEMTKPVEQPPIVVVPEAKEKVPETPANAPVRVEIHEDPVSMVVAETREFGLGLVAFLLLVLFILAYGNRITRQFSEDEKMAAILERMAEDVSRYLFTITMINAGLGICIGLAMWGLGMPQPILWGVMAMLLNFIPYVGAMAGTFAVFMAAAVNFDKPMMVLAVPVIYFCLTAIEGNLVTPTVLGTRFKINPLVVFVWVFAWASFWGIAGMLIAMPALVIFKIVCRNYAKLDKFRQVLEA